MAYYVERLNLKVGDPINWSKVEPDVVVDVIDPPTGHIVVGVKAGHIHAWWGRWSGEKKVLTHHGGRFGWSDIQRPIDQHNNVLEKYLGHEVKIGEVRPEMPVKPRSLGEFVAAVRVSPDTVEVSGRNAWVGEALYHIDRAMRGVTYPIHNATDANWRASQLTVLQEKLHRSTNPNFRSAGRNLSEALSSEGQRSMGSFSKSQDDLLNSLIEMNDIVIGTFERLSRLERYRWGCEDVIIGVHQKVAEAQSDWGVALDDSRRVSILSKLSIQLFGIYPLTTLRVQPFRKQVEDLFAESKINILNDFLVAENLDSITRALEKAESRLFRLHQRIDIRRQGARQLQFP